MSTQPGKGQDNTGQPVVQQQRPRRLNIARLAVLVLAVGFIALGVYRGEVMAVFRKAIVVCLECIGLG